MPRKHYPTTDETRAVLNGHEQTIAKAKGCCPSYIFNIKNLNESDPYPVFREWFLFCAAGGGDVRVYLNDLETIAAKFEGSQGGRPLTKRLTEKLDTDCEAEKVIAEANADGKWDIAECDRIMGICDKTDRETERLRQEAIAAKNRLTPMRKIATAKVGEYRAKKAMVH